MIMLLSGYQPQESKMTKHNHDGIRNLPSQQTCNICAHLREIAAYAQSIGESADRMVTLASGARVSLWTFRAIEQKRATETGLRPLTPREYEQLNHMSGFPR